MSVLPEWGMRDEHRQVVFRTGRSGQRLPRVLERFRGEARNDVVVLCGQRRAIQNGLDIDFSPFAAS